MITQMLLGEKDQDEKEGTTECLGTIYFPRAVTNKALRESPMPKITSS